jgi:uncharacterized protein with ATP-grasp and redox domains
MFEVHRHIKIDFSTLKISAYDENVRSSKTFRASLFAILSNSREDVFDEILYDTANKSGTKKLIKMRFSPIIHSYMRCVILSVPLANSR